MEEFPHELSLAIKGLDNEYRQRILLSLNDVEKLSFSEIGQRVGIEKSLLANHLKTLGKTLLIEHYYEHEIGNERFSYYRISPFGKTLLGNMMGTLTFQQIEFTVRYLEMSIKATNVGVSPLKELKNKLKTKMIEASSGDIHQQTVTASEW